MINNQNKLQENYWRQDITLPMAGADFPDEEDEEDDDLPGGGNFGGEGESENPSSARRDSDEMSVEVTIRPLPSSTSMARTSRARLPRGVSTPWWVARPRLSDWHRS